MTNVVHAHDDVRRLVEVIHYPDHDERTESDEFRRIKHDLHAAGTRCYIDNGRCDGPTEVHHGIIEYSAANEVVWDAVKRDHGFDHVDAREQMMPLCRKHHRGVGTGIHEITYPAWILQKYLTAEALDAFEAAVTKLREET